jgi:hypothetical protein
VHTSTDSDEEEEGPRLYHKRIKLKKLLIPYYKEPCNQALLEDPNNIPNKLWENFDNLPSEQIQKKMNLYYHPTKKIDHSKFMSFGIDE